MMRRALARLAAREEAQARFEVAFEAALLLILVVWALVLWLRRH